MIELLFAFVAFLIAMTGAIHAIQKLWKAGKKLLEALSKETAKRRRRRQVTLNPGNGRVLLPKEEDTMTNRELLFWVIDPHRTEAELVAAGRGLGLTIMPAHGKDKLVTKLTQHISKQSLDDTALWTPPAPPAGTTVVAPTTAQVTTPAEMTHIAPVTPEPASTTTHNNWVCPQGHTNTDTAAFCTQCGAQKPVSGVWTCPQGHANLGGSYCSQCGAQRRTNRTETWTCSQGHTNTNSAVFCSSCGENRSNRRGTNNPLEFLLPRPDSPLGRIFRRPQR